jgi:muconolactone delta-isomerase
MHRGVVEMKILAIEHDAPGLTDDDFAPHLADEARRAWELHQSGIIRELYFRADEEAAVLVLECADVQEAQTVLSTLPLVKAGLISFELIPLKAYPGFARLFCSR